MILGGVEWVSNSVRVVDGEARGEDGLKDGWEKKLWSRSLREVGMGKSFLQVIWCGAQLRSTAAVLCLWCRLKPDDHWLGMVRGEAWP